MQPRVAFGRRLFNGEALQADITALQSVSALQTQLTDYVASNDADILDLQTRMAAVEAAPATDTGTQITDPAAAPAPAPAPAPATSDEAAAPAPAPAPAYTTGSYDFRTATVDNGSLKIGDTVIGSVTGSVTLSSSDGLQFGPNQYVSITDSVLVGGTNFTIEWYFKYTSGESYHPVWHLFDSNVEPTGSGTGEASANTIGLERFIPEGDRFALWTSASGSTYDSTGLSMRPQIAIGEWLHMVLVQNATSRTLYTSTDTAFDTAAVVMDDTTPNPYGGSNDQSYTAARATVAQKAREYFFLNRSAWNRQGSSFSIRKWCYYDTAKNATEVEALYNAR